uniref:Uncharacterized protein n=1 Tax=Vespula pensylvanica TaxID=30213 RepID=A0A834UEL8_VESPE|nr:hypothetical protein H0235_002731 [Vespula pensylvanica]
MKRKEKEREKKEKKWKGKERIAQGAAQGGEQASYIPECRIHEKSTMEEICMRVEYKLAEYPQLSRVVILDVEDDGEDDDDDDDDNDDDDDDDCKEPCAPRE